MIGGSVAKRYATALMGVARDQGKLEEVGKELERFVQEIAAHPELKAVMESPVLPLSQKKKILEILQQKLSLSPILQNLLQILLDQDRMVVLPVLFLLYRDMADESLNKIRVEVKTAADLGDNAQKLQDILTKSLKKEVVLETIVEPSLLAGIVVKVGDRVFDASLRRDLDKIKKNVMEHSVLG